MSINTAEAERKIKEAEQRIKEEGNAKAARINDIDYAIAIAADRAAKEAQKAVSELAAKETGRHFLRRNGKRA